MRARYERLAIMYEVAKMEEGFIRQYGKPSNIHEWRRKYIREMRDEIRKIDRDYPDPLAKPMTEAWRGVVDDEYGDCGYHYRIMPEQKGDEWTDEEIEEYILDEVGYGDINSPYDCTGRRFDRWIEWRRCPSGIIMIHRWSTDI